MELNTTKEFSFVFTNGHGQCTLTAPITIPLSISVKEYAYRLINGHSLPCYIEKDFISSLKAFVQKETNDFYTKNSQMAIEDLKTKSINIEKLSELWTKSFQEEHAAYSKPEMISNEVVFSEAYHSLVHSPALDTLLNLEHSYAIAMEQLVNEKNAELFSLSQRQSREMEEAVKNVGISCTDDEVNVVAAKHFEDTQLLESKRSSAICALQESQKTAFIDWVMKVQEDYQTSGHKMLGRIRTQSELPIPHEVEWIPQPTRMEESFTIHLGAQMKQMHNLRLLATDALDLCKHKPSKIGVVDPQHMQTAMSLYSSNLCGLLLFVDNRINSYTGIKRNFATVCQRSGEFHFPDLDSQLESIRETLSAVKEWRMDNSNKENLYYNLRSSSPTGSDGSIGCQNTTLQTGDFYITHHSNLAEIHVLFHMVVDDSLRSSEITSRHPVILGLRNVLKVACMCDITTVTIPLLLIHEMSEEMTIPWCLKRAELLFKCIKGFMMEMASWGGSESRTVQFLVPKGVSEELFAHLATMLPSIFRMSNPLVIKSSG